MKTKLDSQPWLQLSGNVQWVQAGRFHAKIGPTGSGLKTDPDEDQAGSQLWLQLSSEISADRFRAKVRHENRPW